MGLHVCRFDTKVYAVGMIEHKFVTVNGVRLHVAEQGHGSLVLLLHGFPESWYSWRPVVRSAAAMSPPGAKTSPVPVINNPARSSSSLTRPTA
jgi:pimeloyl-ACP methyl ester carboxylesterase